MEAADILAWRSRQGWSIADALRQLGLSRNTYVAYERGTMSIPRYVALACVALEYGLENRL